MSAVELEGEAVRRQLDEVLKSPGFARNERLSRFLRFVVERHLAGRYEDLKESVIGIEVFARKPDYDTKLDPIVRTEARRLRERLSEYYKGAGPRDVLVIDLPKGGYVPILRLAEQAAQTTAVVSKGTPSSLKRRRFAGAGLRDLSRSHSRYCLVMVRNRAPVAVPVQFAGLRSLSARTLL